MLMPSIWIAIVFKNSDRPFKSYGFYKDISIDVKILPQIVAKFNTGAGLTFLINFRYAHARF
jgi:hypothetical protein